MYYFIEPMVEDDVPYVQAIEQQSFTTSWSANTYRREVRNTQSCRYVVAKASGSPPTSLSKNGGVPNAQRTGIFSQLVSTLLLGMPSQLPPQATNPIVGYGGLWVTLDEAHVTTIAVDPIHRGRGIGELMLTTLIDHAYELSAQMLTLEVRVSNHTAQQLYLKYGFQVVGNRRRYYTDNGEDALIMSTASIHTTDYKNRLRDHRRHLFARLQAQSKP
ncbi:ribosomal protein S18-alanine N-acetyltransferase [Candidatus Chloroploca asiatica]|uniref:Ribosomal-protein-alanine N-acetyltransferase n=1 Tax=Candidatus Chloroploca asiatica TaxID=1506545 RepID=A0A2H3KU05_9CHLR|nr:ribosomal protein S18-alanine N-acetyltransferase [Candidatus Chloroploca asiatica]PDV97352.1 ribosomal-protein-alanine N-acetyltransferase [Candidatus Chloroploca asiatica]